MSKDIVAGNEITPHVHIPWSKEWEVGTPDEVSAIYRDFKSHHESMKKDCRGSHAILSLQLVGGEMYVASWVNEQLVITYMKQSGRLMSAYTVNENTITVVSFRSDYSSRKKEWTRYFSFNKGSCWQCTYNENPSSPKYFMTDAIPYETIQLVRELESVCEWRLRRVRAGDVKSDTQARRITMVSNALNDALPSFYWRPNLTKQEVDRLAAMFAKLKHLFTGFGNLTDEFAKEVLDELESIAIVRQLETPSLYEVFMQHMSYQEFKASPTADKPVNFVPKPDLRGVLDG